MPRLRWDCAARHCGSIGKNTSETKVVANMKHIEATPLSSSATAEDIRAVLASATPGSVFSLKLDDKRAAILALTAYCSDAAAVGGVAPPRAGRSNTCGSSGKAEQKKLTRETRFVEITNRLQSGQARSVHAAALQITGGDFNRAHYLGKLYRKRFCLPASAFFQKTDNNSKDLPASTCENTTIEFQKSKGERMASQEEKALAPDKLKRVTPRHFLIDLDNEGLSDATREEILSPLFWQEGVGKIDFGDVVTFTRANAPALNILIGVPHPDGGFYVHDLAETGHIVSRPAAQAEEAAAT